MFRKIWAALMAWLEAWTQARKAKTEYTAKEKRLMEKSHVAWENYQRAMAASPPSNSEHLARLRAILKATNKALYNHRANKPKRPQD